MDMGILVVIISIIMSTGSIFLYCFVGTLATTIFWKYATVSYESLWYKFPVNLQQYVRMITANAQRPHIFNGLGIIDLNMAFFIKVWNGCRVAYAVINGLSRILQAVKTAISFCLMFKKLTE